MIRLACQIPKRIFVACSGGPDSMAALDFCRRGNRNIGVLHYNHGTEFAHPAEALVRSYCGLYGIPVHVGYLTEQPPQGASAEAFWSRKRASWFAQWTHEGRPMVTGHTLDDQVENWVFTSMHGNPHTIPVHNSEFHILRPFSLAKKSQLVDWCERHQVPYLVDPTNVGDFNARARLRASVIPSMLEIHPGLYKSVSKHVK